MEENVTFSTDESAAEPVVSAEGAAVAETPQKKKFHVNQQKLQDNLWGWLFCVPLIIGTVWFVYYTFILAFLLSFTNYQGGKTSESLMEFIGNLSNNIYYDRTLDKADPFHWYNQIFTKTVQSQGGKTFEYTAMNEMGAYLFNTVFYMIGIPIGMVLSVFFAVCMSRDIKGGNLFRVLYYLPCVASSIAIVYTFKLMFRQTGVMNQILGLTEMKAGSSNGFLWMPDAPQIGNSWVQLLNLDRDAIGQNAFLTDPYWCQGILSKTVIIIMSVWKGLGGTIILYVAGLSGVNAATKEAAQIDGANGWQIFWKVTMPDLYPVIFYNIVTSVIGGLQIYAEPELFVGSATGSGSIILSGYVSLIYRYGLTGNLQYGAATAYGVFLAIIIFILTLFQFWLDSRNKD